LLNDWALAEDAVQESFVSGYRAFPQFRGDNLRAWIMRIVANTCRDMLRSRRARPSVPLDPTSADPEDPFRDGDIWSDALRRKGGGYRLLATMPADPSLN
jgi:DNA-directed RNA polymerase specialized sigma24 family protein